MNVQGLIFTLSGVSGVLNSVFYNNLAGVSPDELAGVRKDAADTLATLQRTPQDKLAAMVAKYNDQLTRWDNAFLGDWASNRLQGFRDAEAFLGIITTVMAKSGLHE